MPLPRIPILPGLRSLIPRASLIVHPLLPLTSRLPLQRPKTSLSSWRMFSYSSRRSHSLSPARSYSSSSSNEEQPRPGPGKDATLSQRLKHLIRTYGWYALGMYVVLSTLDFGVAFAAINIIGADQVSRVTEAVKQRVSAIIHSTPPEPGKQEYETAPPHSQTGRESLYAMIVLAYTVHKTLFLPIRVGLTAALTPRLVNWLSRRGWAGGEGTKRAAREMRERLRRDRDRD